MAALTRLDRARRCAWQRLHRASPHCFALSRAHATLCVDCHAMAPAAAGVQAASFQRPALDLVLLLDVSGSMSESQARRSPEAAGHPATRPGGLTTPGRMLAASACPLRRLSREQGLGATRPRACSLRARSCCASIPATEHAQRRLLRDMRSRPLLPPRRTHLDASF